MSRRSGAGAMASMTLACVFGVTLLLSLAAGAGVYRRVADRVERSAAERVGLTYITAKVKGYDTRRETPFGDMPSVTVRTLEDGSDSLFLSEEIDGVVYDTILYVYDGYLRELMCEESYYPGPEAGQPIARAESLTIEEPSDNLLRMQYVDGEGRTQTADIYLRSGG